MKVLVTGGAGYVGTALIPQLLEKGHTVRVIDSLMFGGDQLLPFFRNARFEFQRGDIRDAEAVKQAVRDCDAVIHLAAIVGYPACRKEPDLARTVNIDGTRNIVDAVSKDQLVMYASTGSNYGTVEEICTEETPLNPLSSIANTATIQYKVGEAGHVTLKVYDVLGREISTLVNEERGPGAYTVHWDASSLSSGVYFYKLEAGSFVQTRKLLLLK